MAHFAWRDPHIVPGTSPSTGCFCSGGQTFTADGAVCFFLADDGTAPGLTRHHNSFIPQAEKLWAGKGKHFKCWFCAAQLYQHWSCKQHVACFIFVNKGCRVHSMQTSCYTYKRGKTALHPSIIHNSNLRFTSSAIIFAMAREEVAAGEGAFLTWRILLPISPLPPSNTKSSTKFPSLSNAWALTPDGPLQNRGAHH